MALRSNTHSMRGIPSAALGTGHTGLRAARHLAYTPWHRSSAPGGLRRAPTYVASPTTTAQHPLEVEEEEPYSGPTRQDVLQPLGSNRAAVELLGVPDVTVLPMKGLITSTVENPSGTGNNILSVGVRSDPATLQPVLPPVIIWTDDLQHQSFGRQPFLSMDESMESETAAEREAQTTEHKVPGVKEQAADAVLKPKGGFKLRKALACAAVGLAVQFLLPSPTGIAPQAWTLFSVFCSAIAGLVLEPLPVSAWSLVCVTVLLLTKACTFEAVMGGLKNEAIWLIVYAFFFAKAFEKTGLGERIANMMVAAVGHSTLGLSYSLAAAETLMSPAMPSCTARAGGIFMPVIKFLAQAQGSEPHSGRTKLGAFLVHSQMQASSNIAALFMTGAAQNLLAINIARNMGVNIPDVWITWAKGALLPGLISVVMIPFCVYMMCPPEVKSTPDAPAAAKARLAAMGPLSNPEKTTLVTLGVAVLLWMLGEQLDVSAVVGAMIALSSLLVTGVLTWRDCLEYTPAWDTLVWFAVLASMCSSLASCGLVSRMADMVAQSMAAAKLPWLTSFGILHLIFFYSHYIFASQVGHVGAMYGAFLAMMMAAGVPTTLAAMTLGYSANLFGALTHYASGPAAVFHGSGYMSLKEVLGIGALMGLRSWAVWGLVGMAWWKFLGWY